MAKPEVTVLSAKTLYIGQTARFTIQIVADKLTKCDAIRARIRGEQGWVIGGGQHSISQRAGFPEELTYELSGPTTLEPGVATTFVCETSLPYGMAPTHVHSPAYGYCELRVHVSIPWRIDGRYRFRLPVSVAPPRDVQREPSAVRSNASADRPRIELSLASETLIAGEALVGTCAVFHMDDRDPRDIELALVPLLTLHGRSPRERRGTPLVTQLTLPAGSAGSGVPFRLQLPATMTPSFSAITHDLSWWLVAQTGSFFRGGKIELSVPLTILDPSAAQTLQALLEAPRLGDQRIAALFLAFAEHYGWRFVEEREDDEEPTGQFAIERAFGEVLARIAYDYRGKDGTFVVTQLQHRSLGLALAVAPSSAMRHWFWRDIEVDLAEWDRAHHVSARAAAQAVPFLRGVVPTLRHEIIGELRAWSDSELVCDRPMSTLTENTLLEITHELERAAAAIASAEAAIPPPSTAGDLGEWRSLARHYKGHLALGDLAITGLADGVPVEVKPRWGTDEELVSVRVAYGDPQLAGDDLRAISLRLAAPARDVLAPGVAEGLVEQVTRWPVDLADLGIADGVASVTLQTTQLSAPRIREIVEMLRAALAALVAGHGPYR